MWEGSQGVERRILQRQSEGGVSILPPPCNNRRIKDGWCNSYYPNGEYWEVGTYKDDKKDGKWSYFTEDGKETKGIYKNGKKDRGKFWISVKQDTLGSWIETDDDLWEGDRNWTNTVYVYRGLFTYDGGLWNGLGVFYWRNGNKRGEGLYKDGKHEGFYKRYYESGKVYEKKTM